ncbi:UDP-glucose 4-epimerase GalE [Thiohalomonas denitrificans]|uniref:UDP-glucose 4-epimerase n=1 Tax=Thiohalomonas denitrificans TaxID=415747 RepID=A0A1G5R0R3_9GAMM|nr:UDP-glucose 4-epimerase GalE [Thiohalomonas denitrificans]SCZ67400.1 UDP-glucose 4-epimerase [Thiohalomonas denitrificans]
MRILVVGGAGYIGSHMVKLLADAGHDVVVVDNLTAGYRDAVIAGDFIQADLADRASLDTVLGSGSFDGVMHFASYIQVGESVTAPAKYYQNNVANTLNLLDAMVEYGIRNFIFSSTAAVFGEPDYIPLDELHPKNPVNPYGRTKLMVEQILKDYDTAYGLKSVCLRYFNAAGAHPEGLLGERHDPETHLIPLVLQAASGRRDAIKVFGQDYPTPDGTCIRDYIHVMDLCDAHLLALEKLITHGKSEAFNLGNGNGFSVQEVIDTAEKVSGREIPVIAAERRSGDPARLVADSRKARELLGWEPHHADLAQIVAHAWEWEKHFGGLANPKS